jgi:hypothetical protein
LLRRSPQRQTTVRGTVRFKKGTGHEEIPSRHRSRVGFAGRKRPACDRGRARRQAVQLVARRDQVYTTTAVNQHNLYGDLQGILKFRQGSALNTGNFDIQIDYVRLYRVLPDRSGLLVVGDNIDQNLLVTESWTYVNSGWQAFGPNLPIGWSYAVSRFQLIHKHTVGADDFSGWRFVRTAKWHYDGRCF